MLSQEVLESLECSFMVNGFKHISKNPLILSCGHSVCKSCIPNDSIEEIKCSRCDKINFNDLKVSNECLSQKVLLKVYINQLFAQIEDRFRIELRVLRENTFEQNLKLRIEFIKEEIDIRIDSLKNDIDKLKNELFDDLERIKEEILSSAKIENDIEKLTNEFNDSLNNLMEDNKNVVNKTETRFFEYQDSLRKLHSINLELLKSNFELSFSQSNLKFDLRSIGAINYQNYQIKFVDSSILCRNEITKLNKLCEFSPKSNWKLIFRGSRDGFEAEKFHTFCDNHSNTLCIIQTIDDHVFGGYTTQLWNAPSSGYNYKHDSKAFLYSLKNSHNFSAKFPINDATKAIYCIADYGPIFGEGSDFYITDKCNLESNNWTTFPFSYSAPDHITPDLNFLTSTRNFKVKEIEVFTIN